MQVPAAPWTPKQIILHSQSHCQNLCFSFHHWTNQSLLGHSHNLGTEELETSERLFQAPFVLLSHGLEPDPILNYGNQRALDLWETTWEELVCTPSRLTAEPLAQNDRAEKLRQAIATGIIRNYSGIRISRIGKRFMIENATIWNVIDRHPKEIGQNLGQNLGQAAMFHKWQAID